VRKKLGYAIRAARIEGGILVLRNRLYLPKHLGGRGLIETNLGIYLANGFEQMERAYACDFCGGYGLIERESDKALGREIIDLSCVGAL
jgi:hypothetical protein